ncbi:MAG: hypothetical protein MI757_03760 [Pirellulales bacterium]|nr:hypothetical protein [Pirellulales bacterium]
MELLVVMAIIAILVAILFPAVNRVRANARSTQSKNNLSELGASLKHFEGTQRRLPVTSWETTLLPFADNDTDVFVDPADTNGSPSYALSDEAPAMGGGDDMKIVIIESDERVIDLSDDSCTGSTPNTTGDFATRHLGLTNALLYGGSVRSFERAEIALDDPSHEPLVIWWLPDKKHGMVCGSIVTIDNPNELPSPTGSEPDPDIVSDDPIYDVPAGSDDCATCVAGCSLPHDPIAHYAFENPGDLGASSTGNHGATVFTVDYEANGKVGGAAHFDGSGTWVRPPNSNGMGTHQPGTIVLWAKSASTPPNGTWILFYGNFTSSAAGDGGGAEAESALSYDDPAQTNLGAIGAFHIETNPGQAGILNEVRIRGCEDVSHDTQWHHFAVTWDPDGDAVTYLDGCENGRQSIPSVPVYTASYLIQRLGRANNIASGRRFNGLMDEVRLYDRVLQPCEIAALYNSEK